MTARLLAISLLLMPGVGTGLAASQADAVAPAAAREIPIDGAIGPAVSDYVVDEIHDAEEAGVPAIILRIDTPGGLVGAMRDINKAILASTVPVIGYVGPSGARAASAGTYILYATHIAAMAPATNLGAATPISVIGGKDGKDGKDGKADHASGDSPARESGDEPARTARPDSNQSTEHRKMVNDAVAYIRSLAEQRGRNADWAEHAVREAASLSADQALKQHVINLIAPDETQLLKQIDGRTVHTADGAHTLHTAGLTVDVHAPGWRTRLLALVTDPTVAYLLFMAGIIGLVIEGFNPGATLPGVIGGICLITSLFAFQLLPVNYAGLALIVLGVVLFIAEALVPSFGALGFGGVIAFVFGSIMLMDTNAPGFTVSLAVIVGIAIAAAAAVALVVWLFLRSRRSAVHTGAQGLMGSRGPAQADFTEREDGRHAGRVLLRGESWIALCDTAVARGQTLTVMAVDGLRVTVRPADDTND